MRFGFRSKPDKEMNNELLGLANSELRIAIREQESVNGNL